MLVPVRADMESSPVNVRAARAEVRIRIGLAESKKSRSAVESRSWVGGERSSSETE